MSERTFDNPNIISFIFKNQMDTDSLSRFELTNDISIFPEVGSRLMQRIVEENYNSWVIVQNDNYRYYIDYEPNLTVRIVMAEILFGEVTWLEDW